MNGIIISSSSNHGIVKCFDNNEIYKAVSKGNVIRDDKIIVGDFVEIEIIDENERLANIVKLQNRITKLKRPKIANVEYIVIVMSLIEPNISTFLLNKFLINAEIQEIKPIIVFTKRELLKKHRLENEFMDKVSSYIDFKYDVFVIDNTKVNEYKSEIDKLKNKLKNSITVFAGQTGAGKSSTLQNYVDNSIVLKTNTISKSLNRGKHTTTKTELFEIDDHTFFADTPGFSSFDLYDVEAKDISSKWTVLTKYTNKCKFADCVHINEFDCAVKNDLKNNKFKQFIYDDYVKIFNELNSKKKVYNEK